MIVGGEQPEDNGGKRHIERDGVITVVVVDE
jgi:hypothetical protein